MKTEHAAEISDFDGGPMPKPKPTGEWMVVYERNSDGWYVCANDEPVIEWPFTEREAGNIADAHNAALKEGK